MAQPQAGQPVPPVQHIYPLTEAEVQDGEDGEKVLIFRVFAPNDLYIFKIPAGEALDLANKILAPSIEVPQQSAIALPPGAVRG